MSRRLDYVVSFDAPAGKIYQDLTSRQYWEALSDAYQWLTPQSEITEFSSDESGTDIVFKHFAPRSELHPIARKVLPVDLVVARAQHFDPFDGEANSATGHFLATVPAMPGHFSGRYFLSDLDDGRSQLRLTAECKVRIPLVGGTIEQLIVSNITTLFDSEEAFTADWIVKHH
jgi:hypothetical protein